MPMFVEMIADLDRPKITSEKKYSPLELFKRRFEILRECGFEMQAGTPGVYVLDPTRDWLAALSGVMSRFERVPGLIWNLEKWEIRYEDGHVEDCRKGYARVKPEDPRLLEEWKMVRKEYGMD